MRFSASSTSGVLLLCLISWAAAAPGKIPPGRISPKIFIISMVRTYYSCPWPVLEKAASLSLR